MKKIIMFVFIIGLISTSAFADRVERTFLRKRIIKALDANGLQLQDKDGNLGLTIEDGGSVTFTGVVTSSKSYAIYCSSTVVVTTVAGGEDNFTSALGTWEDVFLSNFSRNGSTLTYSGGTRKYLYNASMSVSCDSAADIHFRVMLNGATIGGTEQHRKFSVNSIGSVSLVGGIELTANDTICLAVSGADTENVNVQHLYITLTEFD